MLNGFKSVLGIGLLILCLSVLSGCRAPESPKTPQLPDGFVAYDNVSVVVVGIDHAVATEGRAAQQAIRAWAHETGRTVIVIGCIPVDYDVDTCPSEPFVIHGDRTETKQKVMR